MDTEANSITFRLKPDALARLVHQAEQAGLTKHALARTLVVRALDSAETADATAALTAVEEAISDLRQATARGVAAILQNVCDLDEEAIREWVSRRMLEGLSQPHPSSPQRPPSWDGETGRDA